MDQTEIHLSPVRSVTCHAGMSIINNTRTCATGEGSKGTVLATVTCDGDNLSSIDRVYPNLTDYPFLPEVNNHDSDLLKFWRSTSLIKALKPKQNVAIQAPIRINSKYVRCSIL